VIALRRLAPPVVVAVGGLLAWQWFVTARDIKPFLLPAPTAVWDQIQLQWAGIRSAAWVTGLNALIGLLSGLVLGTVTAVVSSRFRVFEELFAPLAAALNAMPIIALAPILNNAISNTNETPRRILVTIIVFFPVFINVLKGLRQVQPVHAELMRSYAADGWALTSKVRLPAALPFFFTAFRLAASLCVITAVVAEYFGGLQNGLGSRITSNAAQTKTAAAWAYVTAAVALGLLFYFASIAVERVAMPWRARRTAT
jgi:NitT/TauT family transport system permease protein